MYLEITWVGGSGKKKKKKKMCEVFTLEKTFVFNLSDSSFFFLSSPMFIVDRLLNHERH